MKIKFKHTRTIDGHKYHPGNHELPDSLEAHWYFLALLNNKDISYVEKPKVASPSIPPASTDEKPEMVISPPVDAGDSLDEPEDEDFDLDEAEMDSPEPEQSKPKVLNQPTHKKHNKR